VCACHTGDYNVDNISVLDVMCVCVCSIFIFNLMLLLLKDRGLRIYDQFISSARRIK